MVARQGQRARSCLGHATAARNDSRIGVRIAPAEYHLTIIYHIPRQGGSVVQGTAAAYRGGAVGCIEGAGCVAVAQNQAAAYLCHMVDARKTQIQGIGTVAQCE